MANPLISVCVPTYNGEKYLKECLDSCIAQTFSDYEIIICDDGSSDKTVEIIETYGDPRIKFYRNEKNLGLVGNWNKCIELSSGKWIKFVFQDDSLTPGCLDRFIKEFDEHTGLFVCKRNFKLDKIASVDEEDYYRNRVRTLENTGYFSSNAFSAPTISKIAAQNIALNFIGEPSLTIFKKEMISKIGLFDPDLKQICDLEFLLRIASNYGLKYIPEQLCIFRIHDGSTTEKNVTGKNYYTESLAFAIKLITKPGFKKLSDSLSFFGKIKIRAYIKYQSYKAFNAIDSEASGKVFLELKQGNPELFFKKYEGFFWKFLTKIRRPN